MYELGIGKRGDPFNTHTVLIQRCDKKDSQFDGGGAIPRWPDPDKLTDQQIEQLLASLPTYRTPRIYVGAESLNENLGCGPSLLIGINPLAIAFVDVDTADFFAKLIWLRSGQPTNTTKQQTLSEAEEWIANKHRLIFIPTKSELGDRVTKLAVYPETMSPEEAEKVLVGRVDPTYEAKLYTFDKPVMAGELLPLIGNEPKLRSLSSKIETILASNDAPKFVPKSSVEPSSK